MLDINRNANRPQIRTASAGLWIWAGLVAGTMATLMQVLLWLAFTDTFPDILFRDARLTAALVLGISVLQPSSSIGISLIMTTATVIHFALSIAYAALLAALTTRLETMKALWAGAAFGVALYVINLYGFTFIFPWFVQARDWITLIAHGVFGVSAVLALRWRVVSNAQS